MSEETPAQVMSNLRANAVSGLRAARRQLAAEKRAIETYLTDGYRLKLTPGELVDLFCVSTPNIVEMAGYADADGDRLTELFDVIHEEIRSAH